MTGTEQAGRTELAGEIEARKAELANRAMDRMYENPFWDAPFGERGRSFSAEDGQYHVTYLVEALRSGNQQVFTRYARWLQSVLTTRGMCTLHLVENFECVEKAIRESGIENLGPAVAYLGAGIAALRYDSGPARAIQTEADMLLGGAVQAIHDRRPNLPDQTLNPGHDQALPDLPYLISYLSDALALDRTDVFVDHVCWLAGYYDTLEIPLDQLREVLIVLGESLASLRDADHDAAMTMLDEARAALEGGS